MPAKRAQFIPRGMTRDLAVSKFSPEYAYENKNLRLIATDENTSFVLANEKGNERGALTWDTMDGKLPVPPSIYGTPIGQQVLDNSIILFTAGDKSLQSPTDDRYKDHIYKFWLRKEVSEALYGRVLFEGDLNFSPEHPIESIGIYENNNLKKVYWTDGYNQPRVINTEATADIINSWKNNPDVFNFLRRLNGGETVSVTKNLEVGGVFAPGVLQYYFTYFDMYGQETNIFASSPLLYTSYLDRGASPDDTISTGFNISISNVDPNFDKIRIYSILRTSLDATPQARIVKDIQIESSVEYEYNVNFDSAYIYSEDPTAPGFSDTFVVSCKNGVLDLSEIIIRDKDGNDKTLADYNNVLPLSICPFSIFKKPLAGPEHWIITDIVIDSESLSLIEYPMTSSWGYVGIPVGNIVSCKEWGGAVITEQPSNIDYHSYEYIDDGTEGMTIDPTELLFKNRAPIIAETMAQKDNTLFLGNISSKVMSLPANLKADFADPNNFSVWEEEKINYDVEIPNGYYVYDSQLKRDSYQIKNFKSSEYYRLGVQFKHETGYWSEAIFITDYKVRSTPHTEMEDFAKRVLGNYIRVNLATDDLYTLYELGFREARPVIVYPSLNDRECVCQGILCPTVYNASDRVNGAPFAQSSWFVRPSAPFDPNFAKETITSSNAYLLKDLYYKGSDTQTYSDNSIKGLMMNHSFRETLGGSAVDFLVSEYGSWPEFRHNYPIPSNDQHNAEIQCITHPPHPYLGVKTRLDVYSPYNYVEKTTSKEWAQENEECFYVDQSIFTMHSPDIEFNTELHNYDMSKLELRIVGKVNIGSSISDVSIQTTTSALPIVDDDIVHIASGFSHQQVGVKYFSNFGWKSLISAPLWFDGAVLKDNGKQNWLLGYMVYPWQKNGSLNNDRKESNNSEVSSKLKRKVQSTLRFSETMYYGESRTWYAKTEGSSIRTGISGATLFDSNEMSLVKIPAPANSSMSDIVYYGNVDKVISQHITSKNLIIDSNLDNYVSSLIDKTPGNAQYPSVIVEPFYKENPDTATYTPSQLFNGTAIPVKIIASDGSIAVSVIEDIKYTGSNEPVSMKYKSTPHAVIAFNYTEDGKQRILPLLNNTTTIRWNGNDINIQPNETGLDRDTSSGEWLYYEDIDENNPRPSVIGNPLFWDEKGTIKGVQQDSITDFDTSNCGYLWLGELYNPNVVNRFGGTSEAAIANNNWTPCGESVPFSRDDDEIHLEYREGDTYFQRYDCLKTYPFTQEDQNSIVDIISFECETRVNIDGRYDRNRGLTNNLNITPQNFNLLNPVYSQSNNFLTYHGKDSTKINVTDYPNTITWTKTKTLGEEIDTWTDITLASTLDLDGDLGQIRALRRLGDNILSFQDSGISQILYNDNVQISSTAGVPIEIANSGKVSGKRYLPNKIGCTNKWSICSTPNGLYFLDSIGKDIYLFNGEFANLSEKLGFRSWVNSTFTDTSVWNPKDFNSCTTLYDRVNDEVLFVTKDTALAYSEALGGFSSFYDYGGTPFMANIEDKVITWYKNADDYICNPWFHHKGEYNSFYGEYKPFWTTVIVNPEPTNDKVFNNVEYRADIFDVDNQDRYLKDASFDTLNVWNEYQAGVADLENIKDRPSNLKKKFRIWRANIPRWNIDINGQTANGRDRMRNPWLYLKLSMEKSSNLSNNHKTLLHDIIVDYFD